MTPNYCKMHQVNQVKHQYTAYLSHVFSHQFPLFALFFPSSGALPALLGVDEHAGSRLFSIGVLVCLLDTTISIYLDSAGHIWTVVTYIYIYAMQLYIII